MGVLINAHGQPSAAISGLRQVRAQSTSWYHHRVRPGGLSYARRWLNRHYGPSRLNTFSIRCSLVNTDVCHSIENEEVHEDTMSLEPNCLITVVHLEFDTLETDGFNLLVGDSYVGTILMQLPVLSEEEQNAIAATPAHPAGLYALYACCLAGNYVEQLWNFTWPAAIASIYPSLRPVAIMGFFAKFAVIVGGLRPSIIGGFNVLYAFIGVAATFVSAKMVKRLGLLEAGASGLIFQASLLMMAVAVYWTGSVSQKIPFLFFLCLIVLSRLGHMSYDVVGAQILQTGIPASKANLIGTTEASVASLVESVMLGIVIILINVLHFGFLAVFSLLSVDTVDG